MATLVDVLPSGSYLVLSHVTADYSDRTAAGDAVKSVQDRGVPIQTRSAGELTELTLTGLRPVEPGLVPVSEWHPAPGHPRPVPREVGYYEAVARKP